jgi:hypothetical protein
MRKAGLIVSTMMLTVSVVAAGCGGQDKPPDAPIDAPPPPQIVTNLQSLSSEKVEVNPFKRTPIEGQDQTKPGTGNGAINGPRTFERKPGIVRNIGTEDSPGEERLLNEKAAKFANFAQVILDRVYAQLRVAERTDEIARLRLPTDLQPVLITATMNKEGKLTELVVEQHSGKAAIDKMMIDVCKKAIWYRNPPVEAQTPDGVYRLTISCRLENFASMEQGRSSFTTYLGLGIA